MITCDVDKVERILLNLLSNAIKFTDEGGRISIFLNDEGNHITLSVEDTGVGIPQDKLQQIFARFHQVDKTFARNYEGSGIGLSLVKSMVEMHGGTISVISDQGKGSKFMVRLPVYQAGLEHTEKEYQYDRNQFNQRIQIEMSDFFPQSGTDE
jgi:signal transduction histidine kinase